MTSMPFIGWMKSKSAKNFWIPLLSALSTPVALVAICVSIYTCWQTNKTTQQAAVDAINQEANLIIQTSIQLLDQTIERQRERPNEGVSPIRKDSQKRLPMLMFSSEHWQRESYRVKNEPNFKWLQKVFSLARQANFLADKVRFGKYQEDEGKAYVDTLVNIVEQGPECPSPESLSPNSAPPPKFSFSPAGFNLSRLE